MVSLFPQEFVMISLFPLELVIISLFPLEFMISLFPIRISWFEFAVQVQDLGRPRLTAQAAARVIIYVTDVNGKKETTAGEREILII